MQHGQLANRCFETQQVKQKKWPASQKKNKPPKAVQNQKEQEENSLNQLLESSCVPTNLVNTKARHVMFLLVSASNPLELNSADSCLQNPHTCNACFCFFFTSFAISTYVLKYVYTCMHVQKYMCTCWTLSACTMYMYVNTSKLISTKRCGM